MCKKVEYEYLWLFKELARLPFVLQTTIVVLFTNKWATWCYLQTREPRGVVYKQREPRGVVVAYYANEEVTWPNESFWLASDQEV